VKPVTILAPTDEPLTDYRRGPGVHVRKILDTTAQGAIGRSRHVGPIRTAYIGSVRKTVKGTGVIRDKRIIGLGSSHLGIFRSFVRIRFRRLCISRWLVGCRVFRQT